MEESGSFVKVVLKDMSSLDSASRACQLVSHLTKTTSSLGLQGPTTGKVMRYAFDELLMMFFFPLLIIIFSSKLISGLLFMASPIEDALVYKTLEPSKSSFEDVAQNSYLGL